MNKKTFFKKQKREGISYKVIFGFILLCLFAYIPYTYYLSLSLEYTKTQEVLRYKGDIVFDGYKNKPCSVYLETNNSELDFNKTASFAKKYDAVAYYKNGELMLSNYILAHTSKELLMKYIRACDKELVLAKQNAEVESKQEKKIRAYILLKDEN